MANGRVLSKVLFEECYDGMECIFQSLGSMLKESIQ